jgi:hypothetical protein
MSNKPKAPPPVDLDRLHKMMGAMAQHAITLDASRREALLSEPVRRPIERPGEIDADMAREICDALRKFYEVILEDKLKSARLWRAVR